MEKINISSIGIGLTNSCNLNCSHCYSRKMSKENLCLKDVEKIIKDYPNLSAVNLGTGESILNQELRPILKMLSSSKIKIGLTTNGLTVQSLEDEYLKLISEYDISLDFPNQKRHDSFRGKSGTYKTAISSIEKLKNLDKEVSIAMALTSQNYKYLGKFKKILDKYDIPLRLNIYKPVNNKKLSLSYAEFWRSMKVISKKFKVVSCSEPILSLLYNNDVEGSPCGQSLRIHPDKKISGCVYLEEDFISYDEFIKLKLKAPAFCNSCHKLRECHGGCLARRLLDHRQEVPDLYCPIYRGEKTPKIKFNKYIGERKGEYIHSSYLCTLIIR